MTATQAMRTNLRALAAAKSSKQLPLPVTPMHDFNDFIGFTRVDALQKQYMMRRARLTSPIDHPHRTTETTEEQR